MDTAVVGSVDDRGVEATQLVGRRAEIAQVKELLSTSRLVTLTGVAGVGKTRLARKIAWQLQEALAGGVGFVELAPLHDPALVAHTTAMALGIPLRSPAGLLADLIDYVRDEPLLLVVDNCEHLIDACADVVDTLLRADPELRVLATSRQPLNIAGERLWPVPPLSTSRDRRSVGDANGETPAVSLFAERASSVLPSFTITTDNHDAVADICRQVDGLPLAIELAAARLAGLSMEQLLTGLHDRYRLLAQTSATGAARHESLRAAIDWSYELCSPAEQRMWQRLSVFPDDFDLDAAEQVCAFDDLSVDDVFALVDKSVLVLTGEQRFGRARYRLLDVIARYGQEKLRASGEETMLRRRHRDWYFDRVEDRAHRWFGSEQARLVTELRAEHADLRTALEFSLATPGEADTGLSLAANLWFYWRCCGLLTEGRYWLDSALNVSREQSSHRAKALWANGWVTAVQGDTDSARVLAGKANSEARRLGDDTALAHATQLLGLTALLSDDLPRAATLLEEARQRFAAEAGKQAHDSDLASSALLAHAQLALVRVFQDDLVAAVEIADVCRRGCEQHGEQWVCSHALYALALAEWQSGRLGEATTHARNALRIRHRFHDMLGMALRVDLLAWVASSRGHYEHAAVLLGAAQRLWQQFGRPLFGSKHWTAHRQACEARCRAELGSQAYHAALHHGGEFSVSQMIAYAIAE